MSNNFVRTILPLALLLLPGSLIARQQEQAAESPDPQDVRYEIRFVDLHTAEVLAWDQCTQKERCRVSSLSAPTDKRKGFLDVRAEPAAQEKIARLLAKQDTQPRTHGFQIVLLAASAKPSSGGLEVPANIRKALTDLKGFLPFKSYEVLDTAWLSGTQDRGIEARLVDRQGAGYLVALQFHDAGSPADHTLFADVFRLRAEAFRPQGSSEPRPGGSLIDTSFGVKEGETIVVGTSRVNGSNDALVVLLTAAPAS